MIWNRVPKANHVGLDILSSAVYDAISHFNENGKAAFNIFNKMNMDAGKYTVRGLNLQDIVRKRRSAYRMPSPQKQKKTNKKQKQKQGKKSVNISEKLNWTNKLKRKEKLMNMKALNVD